MNIYLVTQEKNSEYDTYDSAVVYANSEDEAKSLHPQLGDGCSIEDIKVEYVGRGTKVSKTGIILSSFNAG